MDQASCTIMWIAVTWGYVKCRFFISNKLLDGPEAAGPGTPFEEPDLSLLEDLSCLTVGQSYTSGRG